MGKMISFSCSDGHQISGYLAEAANEGAPGIVVIQEWWGLNDQIKGIADRFAAAGITALAPDLFAGRVTQDPDEAEHMMTGLDWVGATEQDVRGAVQHLKTLCPKVAVTGFCMGGALTLIAGVKIPEMDAGVCFYGIPPVDQADPSDIRVPLQAHFATQDDWCTPDSVNALEQQLKGANRTYELYRYEAQHGFVNEQRADVHDAAATRLAWDRTIEFLYAQLA